MGCTTCKREQCISLHRAIEGSCAKVFERLSALSILDRRIRGACSADSEGGVDVDDDAGLYRIEVNEGPDSIRTRGMLF